MHTTSILDPHRKTGTWANGLLLGLIAAQPALDSLTFWLMSTGRTNWVAYLRAVALGIFGLLVLLQERKIAHWVLSAVWGVYVLSKYPLSEALLPGSGLTETINMLRTMLTPMFTLWLFWYVQEDPRRGARTITHGLLAAAVILTALAAVSLLTGTYEPTYEYAMGSGKPNLLIGFSAWSNSPNAQSIVLSVLLALCAPMLARWRRPWALLVLLATFGLMMFFHATRTAYYALLLDAVALCAALGVQILRGTRLRWWALASAVVFLVLAVVLKPLSPLATADQSRTMIGNIAKKLQSEAKLTTPAPEVTPAPTEQPTPTTPAAMLPEAIPWDTEYRDVASMFYFKQMDRYKLYLVRQRANYDPARIDAAAYEYIQKRMALPPQRLSDNREGQILYVKATLRQADPLRLLTGFGVTWFTEPLGSVENDYAAIIGYFGILGCVVFFGVILWVLYQTLRCIRWRYFISYVTPEIIMAITAFFMMLGLGGFSGRVFQQGSVSFYLALVLAALYGHVRLIGEEGKPVATEHADP